MLITRLRQTTAQILAPQGFSKLDSVIVPLAIMIVGAGLNFLMLILIARLLPADRFSSFAYWYSILSMLAGIGVAGQGTLIFKNWNSYFCEQDFRSAKGALWFGATVTGLGAACTGMAVGLIQFFGQAPSDLIAGSALFVFLLTLLYFVSPLTRAISGFVAGDSNMEITWRLIAVIIFAAMALIGFEFSVSSVFLILSVGATASLLFCCGLCGTQSAHRNQVRKVPAGHDGLEKTITSDRNF